MMTEPNSHSATAVMAVDGWLSAAMVRVAALVRDNLWIWGRATFAEALAGNARMQMNERTSEPSKDFATSGVVLDDPPHRPTPPSESHGSGDDAGPSRVARTRAGFRLVDAWRMDAVVLVLCWGGGVAVTTRVIKSETDRQVLLKILAEQPLPFTCDVVKGARRSVEQNRLQRLWMNEISEQLGDQTPEEVRAYCKAFFGVPILRAENTAFCDQYDRIVKPLTYEQKLQLMAEPLDLPVTRIMTTDQKTRYLDAVYRFWTEKGITLTEPDERRAA